MVIETLEKPDSGAKPAIMEAISADSHITEPGNCYIDYIDPAYRDRAPHLARDTRKGMIGDVFIIEGYGHPLALARIAAAGRDPKDLAIEGSDFADLHRGGWDPKARLLDQDRDGVIGEMIYPTIGMVLCGHPDLDFKNACLWAYNRWLQEFTGGAPDRLFGLGMTAVRSVPEAIEDFRRIKEMGFRGVMMPAEAGTEEDYDDPSFDPLWRAAVELDLPLSFHIITGKSDSAKMAGRSEVRGPSIGSFNSIYRGCQDIIGMFIFGGVFERHPALKLVCVEADAGWAPHYMYRMDHAYNRHRYWLKCAPMSKLPSAYFSENVYLTFQDDWVAFRMTDMCNPRRLMWANDFPHSDATWPWSQEMLAEHTKCLTEQEKAWILRENVTELYKLPF
jgi:predicted TIM-barrel fold metal-dependent hydrolase